MPRGIGYHDCTPYLQSLLDAITNLPLEYLSDEIKELLNNPDGITFDQLSPELQELVMTATNVGYDNLDSYLQSKIDDIGKISGDTVYISNNNIFKGTREVYEDVHDVNFICGDIKDFTMYKDTLNVYLNTVRLAEGIDYVVNEDRVSIRSLRKNGWEVNKPGTIHANKETYNLFEFELYKNSTIEAAGDGVIKNEYLQNDSITMEKFTPEVRELIYNNVSLIKNNVYFGYREITIDTAMVNFICGEIDSFKDGYDVIEVFLNGTRLTRGVNYEVNDARTIRCLEGYWTITEGETYNFFEFVVEKNVSAQFDPTSSQIIDTENLVDESITKEKLSPEVWSLIDDKKMLMQIRNGYAVLTDEEIASTPYIIGEVESLTSTSRLHLHVNSVKLTEGVDYTLDKTNELIVFTTPYKASEQNPVYIDIEVITASTDRPLIASLERDVTFLCDQVNKLNDTIIKYTTDTNKKIEELEARIEELTSAGAAEAKAELTKYANQTDAKLIIVERELSELQDFALTTDERLVELEDSTEMEIVK